MIFWGNQTTSNGIQKSQSYLLSSTQQYVSGLKSLEKNVSHQTWLENFSNSIIFLSHNLAFVQIIQLEIGVKLREKTFRLVKTRLSRIFELIEKKSKKNYGEA